MNFPVKLSFPSEIKFKEFVMIDVEQFVFIFI